MEEGFVVLSVLVALLAVWGGLMLWRGLFEWWFAPLQITGAVVLSTAEDLENLDFLLCEAEKDCMCHKDSRIIVILMPHMVEAWRREIQLADDKNVISPDMVLHHHGAVLLAGDFLDD